MKKGLTIITLMSFVVLLAITATGASTLPVEKWYKTFGGSGSDEGCSVQQTSDGYIIVGDTKSFGTATRPHFYIFVQAFTSLFFAF